jgi:flagella basal body P-ring formation protein FlgA
VPAGQALRPEYLRPRPALAAGDAVRLLFRGEGFMVMAEARALSGAAEGESARVQLASGRQLTGTARAGRVVEVRY